APPALIARQKSAERNRQACLGHEEGLAIGAGAHLDLRTSSRAIDLDSDSPGTEPEAALLEIFAVEGQAGGIGFLIEEEPAGDLAAQVAPLGKGPREGGEFDLVEQDLGTLHLVET